MEAFLRTLLSFPAVPFTALLGIALLYWLFVLLGVVAFDGDGAFEGGAKAASDVMTGALKGAGEAVASGVKAAGDAVTGGAKAGGEAMRAAVATAEGGGSGVLALLGFGKVPSTISGSFLVFFSWAFSMFGSSWLGVDAGLLAKSGVFVASMVLAVTATAIAVKPIVRAFTSEAPQRRHHFIGKVCEVTSGRVSASFGTATVNDGGAGLNLHVACDKANQLKKGDRALIVDFDEKTETWNVEPLDWLEPQELEALNDPARVSQVLSSRMRTRG
jgi:hypothetical protein